jgi:hypothetical protein
MPDDSACAAGAASGPAVNTVRSAPVAAARPLKDDKFGMCTDLIKTEQLKSDRLLQNSTERTVFHSHNSDTTWNTTTVQQSTPPIPGVLF